MTRGAKSLTLALVCLLRATAWAQDTRVVTEPVRPAACVTLRAALVPVADSTLTRADERRLDTDRIQRAIDGCAGGRAVVLAAGGGGSAFLSGPLRLRERVTLVVDSGAILFASRDPRVYDVRPGACGVVTTSGGGCHPLISVAGAHAALMGPGTIDGRGWATLLGADSSWWDYAQAARVGNRSQNNPRLVVAIGVNDFTLYNVTLRNSPNFHVVFDRGDGFTAWGVVIHTPDPRARNTDGIDPISARNVTITRSFINTGDDNVAIKAGRNGPARNITVSHNHWYRGHGVSIGSETFGGVRAIRVLDLSIDGADNGLRIKSNSARGGIVEDVEYSDVCIRRTKHPIEMDTHYSASADTAGARIPEFRDIRLKDVRVLDDGQVILDGYDAAHRLAMRWDNVWFDRPTGMRVRAAHATIARGPGPVNLEVPGPDVAVTGAPSESPPNACVGKFTVNPRTAAAAASADRYTAIVDGRFGGSEGDTIAGVPTYRSIGAALDHLPANGAARAVILVRRGRYREKLTIDRPRVTLRGEERDSTVLTFDAAASTPSPGGGTDGTRGSFTLRIVAPDFRAESLTIENAFDYPANAAKADSDVTKLRNAQAVALMLDLGSDRASFVNVNVTGYQDTLFLNAGRAHFAHCAIWGHVDFIFGAGRAVFDDCDIVSRDRGSATNNGYITAASTPASQEYGFLFVKCRLKKERPAMAPASVTLGRPWHPFADPAAVGSVVFMNSWMDDHIGERGWDRMSSVDSTGARVWYEPETARFAEYGSSGPGARRGARRHVLTAAEARRYTPRAVLEGWIPTASVSLPSLLDKRKHAP